jgi:hypothetical protein
LIAPQSSARDNGYYIVLIPAPTCSLDDASVAEAAALLGLKVPELNRILGIGLPAPLSRVASTEEAASAEDRLRALGIATSIVAHEDLRLGAAAKKIRALELSDEALTAVPTSGNERVTSGWDEVTLLVAGRLILNRQETEERKRRGRKQMVDSRHLSSDESVLDVYTHSDQGNWRISANNFDFSCLRSEKGVTTLENFLALIGLLRERAPNAQFDDSYNRARPALATVWPIEPQTRTGEWRRSGAGKFDVATVTTTDNEDQFRRYSRLLYCLGSRQSASRI